MRHLLPHGRGRIQLKWEDGVQYARDVAAGEIDVCKDVQLACQRFLNQLENKEWRWEFRPEAVQHFLNFTEKMSHVKGPMAGKPMELIPFQILLICAIYGFRDKKDPDLRMVQDCILFIPRKASKSTLIAVIGLYELRFGETGGEVYCTALDRTQASIVFNTAKGIVDSMPPQLNSQYKPYRNEIKRASDGQSTFQALSRDSKRTGDGKNPSVSIVDEAAQIIERNAIEVMNSGMVARKNPLRIYITTASFTKETLFFENMQYLKAMLHGQAEDNPRWFGLLYGLDEGDDWKEPKNWAKVNPMHGISINAEAIEQRVKEAQSKPSAINELLCKTFNVWVSANSAWIDKTIWEEAPKGKPVDTIESTFIAFDLAATRDLNAVCTLHRYTDDKFHAEFKFFLPEESMEFIPTHYKPIFQQAIDRGTLKLTQGNVADYVEVQSYIEQQTELYNAKEIGFDAWNASSLVSKLYEKGLPVKKIGQGMAVLNNPSKQVEKLILSKSISHEHDPFVEWQLGNCEVYVDVNNNIKIRKNSADTSAKVDGIIAMIMAFHCALDNPYVSSSFGFRAF
jgi:phage terminase large subunit-like protein